MGNNQKGSVAGSFYLVGANAYFMLSSYLLLLVLARMVGVEKFGLYILAMSVIPWIERVTADSFTHPITRSTVLNEKSKFRKLLWNQLIISLLATLILVLASEYLAGFLKNGELAILFRVAALDILPFSFFATCTAILYSHKRFHHSALGSVVYGTVKCGATLGLFFLFDSLAWAVAGVPCASIISLIVLYFLTKRIDKPVDEKPEDPHNKERLGYITSLIVVGGSGVLLSIDVWMMQLLSFGAKEVGYYGAAHSLMKGVYTAALSVMWPMIPLLLKYGSFNKVFKEEKQFRILSYLMLSGLFFSAAMSFALPQELMTLLFGENFIEAGKYLQMLGLSYVFVSLGLVGVQLMYHCGMYSAARLCTVGAVVWYLPLVIYLKTWFNELAPSFSLGVIGIIILLTSSLCFYLNKEGQSE